MKKGVLWATLLALLLVLLTGCGDDPAPPVENYDMEAAMEYIKTVYRMRSRPRTGTISALQWYR